MAELLVNLTGNPHTFLSDITHDALQDYVRWRGQCEGRGRAKGRQVSRATINRELEFARKVWRCAREQGFDVGREPIWTKLIDKTAEHARKRELTVTEEKQLVSALRELAPDLLPVVEFSLLSGARKSSVLGIRWKDIDWHARVVWLTLKSRGLEKRRERLALSNRMLEILQSRPSVHERVFTYVCRLSGRSGTARAHQEAGKRYPFSESGWSKQWYAALELAKIEDFRWHDLRHTAATRIVRLTGNLKIAQQMLHHSDISSTARYAHASDDDVRNAMELVEKRYSDSSRSHSQYGSEGPHAEPPRDRDFVPKYLKRNT